MDREERDRLRELEKAATPGPWEDLPTWCGYSSYAQDAIEENDLMREELAWAACDEDDEAFIVAARNAFLPLLDALDAADAEIADLKAKKAKAIEGQGEALASADRSLLVAQEMARLKDAAEARAEKAEAALARERRVSEELAFQIANCPLDAGCDVPDKCACLKDTCEAHEEPPDRRRQIESGCWRAWAESEADKEVPHEP